MLQKRNEKTRLFQRSLSLAESLPLQRTEQGQGNKIKNKVQVLTWCVALQRGLPGASQKVEVFAGM